MNDKPYNPISDEKIEKRMIELPKEIWKLSQKVINLKMEWLNAKMSYKRNFSKAQLEAKVTDITKTQTDLKAIAEDRTYEEGLQVIVKEGEYRKAMADMEELKEGLYALCEVSSQRRAQGYRQQT